MVIYIMGLCACALLHSSDSSDGAALRLTPKMLAPRQQLVAAEARESEALGCENVAQLNRIDSLNLTQAGQYHGTCIYNIYKI